MSETPSYDDLIKPVRSPGRRPSELAARIAQMKPGDILDAGAAMGRNSNRVSVLLAHPSGHVRTHSSYKYATRVRNGRVYVLCLREEDVRPPAQEVPEVREPDA